MTEKTQGPSIRMGARSKIKSLMGGPGREGMVADKKVETLWIHKPRGERGDGGRYYKNPTEQGSGSL